MPFTMPNFQPLTPEQTNPYAGIYGNMLDYFAKTQQAAYTPETLKQNILKAQLENKKSQAELPFVAQLAQAKAAYSNAMANYLAGPNTSLKYLSAEGKNLVEPYAISALQRQAQAGSGNVNSRLNQGLDITSSPNIGSTEMPLMTNEKLGPSTFDSLPLEDRKRLIDQARAMGADPIQAREYLRKDGNNLDDLAKTLGYDSNEVNWPKANNLKPLDDSLYGGNNNILSGVPSGIAQVYKNKIQKSTSDPQARNLAVQAQQLAKDVNKIDDKVLSKYSGLGGQISYHLQKSNQALGGEVSDDFLKYQNYNERTKYLIADQIRQALKTSVMPAYIRQTLIPLTDPTSTIFSNPKSVKLAVDTLKKWANDYANNKTEVVSSGVNTEKKQNMGKENIYTPENLQHTANIYGISVDEVKKKLGI